MEGIRLDPDGARREEGDCPQRIDLRVLKGFEAYRVFRNRRRRPEDTDEPSDDAPESQTPEELLENAYLQVRRQIESELLGQIMESPPDFLERVVVDLVVRMGYGGSRKDAGEALGRSGDQGIDGIIKEDPLGLESMRNGGEMHDGP